MAGYEPPSFSLGLDLGLDSEPQIAPDKHPTQKPAPHDEDFGPEVMDSDPESRPEPPRILKRLRRGPTTTSPTTKTPSSHVVDDDIEDFSSEDDFLKDAHPSSQYQSMYSSSKIPLHGSGVLTTKSSSQLNTRKRKQVSDTSASAGLETSRSELIFPRLTQSPLRMFQLIDSDSDDPPSCDNVSGEVRKIGQFSTGRQSNSDHSATLSEQKRKESANINQTEDLWKDFCPTKSFGIPTPAFDEVCEEYFQSLKDKNVPQRPSYVGSSNNDGHHGNIQNDEQVWDSELRSAIRLPNFFPLGVINNRKYQQPNASAIDYMRQFNNEEASKRQATQKMNVKKSSTRGRNKLKKSNTEDVVLASGGWMDPKQNATQKININRSTKGRSKSRKSHAKEVSQAPGSWVEPKSHASTPKDAGKRRVQANGESAGHWFTNSDGGLVYITRSGQELTGQSAYRQYRKESGAGGFRKSKKKASTKKRKG
ncbi:hypothetical protein CMV_020798 [Castanea mollissima]|uniref:Uncharacterized protein n=1 Tax=Castanea mollissima TaxID=60419 RepID=A0A8J4QYC7_9ROSI|nr:hypothetical protein CMV_020798 [Castanea mollissima]